MKTEIEIPFTWTCPHTDCKHPQTDTVNPELGPFVTLICGKCQRISEDDELSPEDSRAWSVAIEKAEGRQNDSPQKRLDITSETD